MNVLNIVRADVGIIGGGLVGTFAALFLRKRGRSVVVLEKDSVGAQASGVNYGNVRLQGRHPEQYPLSLRAMELWEDLQGLIGETCEFTRTGHAYVARSPDQLEKMEMTAAEARAGGVDVEILSGAQARRRWPWLASDVAGACLSARCATANPRLVGPAVARAAKALGATIIERARATAIETGGGRIRIATDQDFAIECEQVINAAGAWAADFSARLGEPVPLIAGAPTQFVTEPMPLFAGPSFQAVDGSVILRQVARGNIVVSGFPRGLADPVAIRAPVPPSKTVNTMAHLAALVPALASAHVIRVWSGIEGYLPDMLPVIGPSTTTPGVIHAFGCCGHGFQISPGVGACLADLATEGSTATPLAAMSISRFKGGIRIDEKFKKEFDADFAKGVAVE